MLLPPRKLVRFGVFEFDTGSGDLWKAGRRVRLQNQPRQVLRALLARPGAVVSREELRRQLWPNDTFVDFDNGLNVAIRKIREALGDAAPSPRFIETERAHGYRFIAPVDEAGPGPGTTGEESPPARLGARPIESSSDPGWRKGTTALALAVWLAAGVWLWQSGSRAFDPAGTPDPLGPVAVAILPFDSGSVGTETSLAAGIADGIISRLSNVRRVRVRSTGAVAHFRSSRNDPRQVGRRLRVQYFLAGTIRTSEDRIRVSVQLVNTADGSPVWAGRYDRSRGDLLGVEDAIAQEIAAALRVRISDVERARVDRRHTRSGAAYERYLMGRALLRSLTEKDTRQAIREFEAARSLDPRYAVAYAGIATAAAQLRIRFVPEGASRIWDARARHEARRALQLDSSLAEAHVALAAVHRFQEYDWDTVIRESLRALELNPSLDVPHLYLAAAYFHLGLMEEAAAAVAEARLLNPQSRIESLELLGAVRLFSGRTADARAHLSQIQELSDSRIVRYLLAWSLYYEGERHRAEAMLAAMSGAEGPLPANARATLAALRAARGATSDARALAERVAGEPDLIHHGAYGLGTAYAQLREPAAALRWLSQASATGFPCYPWYERDPLLDPIRSDTGFIIFMRELRGSWEDARARYGTH